MGIPTHFFVSLVGFSKALGMSSRVSTWAGTFYHYTTIALTHIQTFNILAFLCKYYYTLVDSLMMLFQGHTSI
jgi:hypothetical protein